MAKKKAAAGVAAALPDPSPTDRYRRDEDRWRGERLEEIERTLAERGLPPKCWQAVELACPSGIEHPAMPQPESFFKELRFRVDMTTADGVALAEYIDARRALSEWFELMALALEGAALDWSLRSRNPDSQFRAGRLFGVAEAILNRAWLLKVSSTLTTREAMPFDRERELVMSEALDRYRKKRANGKRHMEACRSIKRDREFQALCREHGVDFPTFDAFQKAVSRASK